MTTEESGGRHAAEPFRGSLAVAEQLLTRRELRSGEFVSLFRDVFLPAGVPITHELRCKGASLVVPAYAVLTGHSAGCLYGLALALPGDPVELIIPEGEQFRAYPGMNVRHVPIISGEYESANGIRLAVPQRMALDLLLNARLRKTLTAAVSAIDAVLHRRLVDRETLRSLLNRRHDHGIVRARRALELADGRAESVPESVLRLLLMHAGIAVTPQVEVCHRGSFVGRVDLAVDGTRIAVEYDGRWHADAEQSRQDARRRQRLVAAGWRIIVVRRDDLYDRPGDVVAAVRAAFYAENAGVVDNLVG